MSSKHTEDYRSTSETWLGTRYPAWPIFRSMKGWMVGSHSRSYWMFFGGMTLFFFLVQLLTGMLLLLYYSATPETAHESVFFIITQVPFGWLIRSFHLWSANLLIGCVFIHLFSTLLLKSYRKPRELVWISGVVLMFVFLGFAFTGYLLPWDVVAYAGTNIGTEIPKSIPLIGDAIALIMRGGENVGGETLKRLFALHVSIFPIISLALIAIHLMLRFMHGLSTPIGLERRESGDALYPEYLFKNAIAWTGCSIILLSLALMLPAQLGPKADILGAAPAGIKPEWYFLFLYQTMKVFPVTVFGVNGEMLVNVGLGIATAGLILMPFIDRQAARDERSRIFTALGIAGILYMVTMTLLAYR